MLKLIPLLIFFLVSIPTHGQVISDDIEFKAKNFKTNFKTNLIDATNIDYIRFKDKILKTDSIKFNPKTGKILAKGNIHFKQDSLNIEAQSADFNIKSGLGSFENSVLELDKGFYLEGKSITRETETKYTAEFAKLSFCTDCTKSWSVTGSHIEIELGGYAVVHHAIVQIKDVPIVYLPVFSYPVKTQRQSGFLIPKFGIDDVLGFEVDLPFFWALSQNSDLSTHYIYQSKFGHSVFNEHRYLHSDKSFFKNSGLLSFNQESEENKYPEFRYGINLNNRAQFSSKFKLSLEGSWSGDPVYSYHNNRILDGSRIPYNNINTTLSYLTENTNLSLSTNLSQANVQRSDSANKAFKGLHNVPRFTFNLMPTPVLEHFQIYGQTEYLRIRAFDSESQSFVHQTAPTTNWIRTGDRLSAKLGLAIPMHLQFISLVPRIEARADKYFFSSPLFKDEAHRFKLYFDQVIEAPFNRVYKTDFEHIKALKHIVTPFVHWSYTPPETLSDHQFFTQTQVKAGKTINSTKFDLYDPNSDAGIFSLDNFDEEQRFSRHHLITFGLKSNLIARFGAEKNRRYSDILNINLEQDYNILESAFEVFRASLSTHIDIFTLNTDVSYIASDTRFDLRNSIGLYFKNVNFRGYQRIVDDIYKQGMGLSLNNVGPFSLSADITYNITEENLERQIYSINYASPSKCWKLSAGYDINSLSDKTQFSPAIQLQYREQLEDQQRLFDL